MNTTELKKLAERCICHPLSSSVREVENAGEAIKDLLAINAELVEALKSYDGGRAIDAWDESYPASKEWEAKRRSALAKAEGGEL